MTDTPALPPLPDLSELEHTSAHGLRILPGEALALIAHVRALQAERENLLELVKRGGSAISAAYMQAEAEHARHETRAERLSAEVARWRQAARAALAASRREKNDDR